jgi:uncharacterized protein Veg
VREISKSLDVTINGVRALAGMRVTVKVNRGRNKTETIAGLLESTYPSIFTVRKDNGELTSFCYADVLSDNVRFL